MERRRPRQHVRFLSGGKRVLVNKGVKSKLIKTAYFIEDIDDPSVEFSEIPMTRRKVAEDELRRLKKHLPSSRLRIQEMPFSEYNRAIL